MDQTRVMVAPAREMVLAMDAMDQYAAPALEDTFLGTK